MKYVDAWLLGDLLAKGYMLLASSDPTQCHVGVRRVAPLDVHRCCRGVLGLAPRGRLTLGRIALPSVSRCGSSLGPLLLVLLCLRHCNMFGGICPGRHVSDVASPLPVLVGGGLWFCGLRVHTMI